MNRHERMQLFCQGILRWYFLNKRILPWRDICQDDLDHKAYLVLVSEIMLQQTQVPRVIILYKKFIQLFPRIEDLSKASNTEVIVAWRGLGYNSRALRLRDTARMIVSSPVSPLPQPFPRVPLRRNSRERGEKQTPTLFPRSMEDLQKLPGIGHYTAGAIRNFAFGIPTPCIDTNIRRILHRFFVGPENADGTWKRDDAYLLRLAGEVLEVVMSTRGKGSKESIESKEGILSVFASCPPPLPPLPSLWHSALMDFGSLVCTKNNPKWDLFPEDLKACCKAYGKNIVRTPQAQKKEPGRMMAGKFVPNRIFRGRIIEALRDAKKGLTVDQIGRHIAIDWTMGDHLQWLKELLKKLMKDGFIRKRSGRFILS